MSVSEDTERCTKKPRLDDKVVFRMANQLEGKAGLEQNTDPKADKKKLSSNTDKNNNVTNFLTHHVVDQSMIPRDNFHKYCYRHNPDVTCNKNTDQCKMNEIQDAMEKIPPRDREAITHVWSIFSAAPYQHRSLILRGLLSQCCFPQLSMISEEVKSLIRLDFISTLPTELSLKILCYLDCASLCNAAQVSRKWKRLADDDRVWHYMCEQHIDRKCPQCGWGLPLLAMKRARHIPDEVSKEIPHTTAIDVKDNNTNKASKNTNTNTTVSKDVAPAARKTRPWKVVYSERYKVERNWRKGVYKVRTIEGHTDGVTCMQLGYKILMTGSYDSTIKIWNLETGALIRSLGGHTRGVRTLAFDDQKLITGGLDGTIKVFNYHTGECISTYHGHNNHVVSLDFIGKTIVSGSADQTVKVWHVETRTCYTLRGHTDWVNSVKIHPKSMTCFSASDDTTIRMWDLKTNSCIKVFGGEENKGHVGQVQCVIPLNIKYEIVEDLEKDNFADETREAQDSATPETEEERNYPTHILTSSLDTTIKLWNVKTGKCVRTQFGHIEGVWSIAADTFRIVSGAHDRTIKVWDLQSGKCMHTFGSNDSSVSCVSLGDTRFASGLENGKIKVYYFD
ncbi:hypothetical protein LJB42_002696 [Komagataella kurtzmanii]|nr:hypothetical protein LJB42_002696 [Komagataella kurtzmanii]